MCLIGVGIFLEISIGTEAGARGQRNDETLGVILAVGTVGDDNRVVKRGVSLPLDVSVAGHSGHLGSHGTHDVTINPNLALDSTCRKDIGYRTGKGLGALLAFAHDVLDGAQIELPCGAAGVTNLIETEDADHIIAAWGQRLGSKVGTAAVAQNQLIAISILEGAVGSTAAGIGIGGVSIGFDNLDILEAHQSTLILDLGLGVIFSLEVADGNVDGVHLAEVGQFVELNKGIQLVGRHVQALKRD